MNSRIKILLIIILMPLAAFAEGKIKILIKKNAVVMSSKIYMRDIAQIEGDDTVLVEKISNVELATAPMPEMERVIDIDFIISRLNQNQIESEYYSLTGAKKVSVYTKFVEISGKEIEKCINDYLDENIDKDVDRVLKFSRLPSKVKAPADNLSIKIIPRKYGNLKGLVNIKVGIYNNERLYKKLNIPIKIRIFESVAVARRKLKRNEILVADDVELKKIETTQYGDRFFKNAAELIGKRLKVSMNEGGVIKPYMVEKPPVIKRGETITLKSIAGKIEISTSGIAREDGWVGKVIRFYCSTTKKDVMAEILSKSVAVIK